MHPLDHLTGDSTLFISMKQCEYCEEEFEPRRKDQKYCRKKCCDYASERKTGSMKRRARRYFWKTNNINIDMETYNKMFEACQGKCEICGRLPTNHTLNVDHCHKTGKIRGLLCCSCNQGLGYFFDSPENLVAAAKYLQYSK